jgi:hypothetical protein
MNQFSGMEMARQRQAEFQREAGLHRQMRATETDTGDRNRHFPRLLTFRRATKPAVGSSRRRDWRLSRS